MNESTEHSESWHRSEECFRNGLELGQSAAAMDQKVEVIDLFRRSMEIDPEGHAFVRGYLAWVLYDFGQFDSAAVEYLRILEKDPDSKDALYYGGLSLLKARRGRAAAPLLFKSALSRLHRIEGWRLLFYSAFYGQPLLPFLMRLYHKSVFWFSSILLSVGNVLWGRHPFGVGKYMRWGFSNWPGIFESNAYSRSYENEFAFELLRPSKEDRILDIGTGGSPFVPYVASLGYNIIASEPDPYIATTTDGLSDAKIEQLSNRLDLLRCDGLRLPFGENSLTRMISISTIEHIPEDGDLELMKEIARVLAPGGRAVVTTEGADIARTYWQLMPFTIGRAYDFGSLDKMESGQQGSSVGFYRLYDPEALVERLGTVEGLELVEGGFLVDRLNARGWFPEVPETIGQRVLAPFRSLVGHMGYRKVQTPIEDPSIVIPGSIGYVVLEKPLD